VAISSWRHLARSLVNFALICLCTFTWALWIETVQGESSFWSLN
jgi:hypothetical protein